MFFVFNPSSVCVFSIFFSSFRLPGRGGGGGSSNSSGGGGISSDRAASTNKPRGAPGKNSDPAKGKGKGKAPVSPPIGHAPYRCNNIRVFHTTVKDLRNRARGANVFKARNCASAERQDVFVSDRSLVRES